jgi:uncharacterized RDD family membrane protein YckC
VTQSAELPGLRRRLAGITYEALLLLGVLSVTFMVPHLVIAMLREAAAPGWLQLIHLLCVIGAYYLWYWHHGGQTLAMQTWKMQLVRHNGGRPSLPQLLWRYALICLLPTLMVVLLAQLLSQLPQPIPRWYPMLGVVVSLLWAFFDRDRQFMHDRLAGTKIIFKQPTALP